MAVARTHGAKAASSPILRSSGRGRAASAQRTGAAGFLGRDQELSELSELLRRERLITLTGPPGIGKSRLAEELARKVTRRYPGARQVVELAPVTRDRDVPRAVAAALSVQEVAGQSLIELLVARLSRRRSLLVLDNCEHLLAGCHELIEALLSGCPELSVVATSHEPLGLASEQLWQLAPLAVPAADRAQTPESLSDYAAVQLFAERAAAVQPGFALNPYVAPAVAEITRRLDGIPLAIELAAARVDSHTPEEIARRLEDRFTLLIDGAGDVLPHHRTLEAALDWSHALLSDSEKAVLRRLSVFSGGFEVEAAEAVCANGQIEAEQVSALLGDLRRKSLLVSDTGEPCANRLRLLETIRHYASERLQEASEQAPLRDAHARLYRELAKLAEPELTGPEQEWWFERLEAERSNLRSALEWSLSQSETEEALCLAGALVLFWRVRCHFSEGRELLEATVAASDGGKPALHAKALWGAGFMALMAGEVDAAIPRLERSVALFRELGDCHGLARALMILGNATQFRDRLRGLSLLEESVAEARAAGDPWCLDHALAMAGFEYSARNDLPAARALFEECRHVALQARDGQGLRWALLGLGAVARKQGDFGLAESLLDEALTLTGELRESFGKAAVLSQLGMLAIARGDFARARELLDEALTLFREMGVLSGGGLLVGLAMVAHAEGEWPRARELYEQSLALGRAGGETPVPALQGLGKLAVDEGDFAAARRLFEEAFELAREQGDKLEKAQALYGLAGIARAAGESAHAANLNREALELFRDIEAAPWIVGVLEALGGVAADGGRNEQAALLLGAAKGLRERHGYAPGSWGPSHQEADLVLLRRRLSERELDAALKTGAELSLDEAVTEALSQRGALGGPAGGWASLTRREREVATLVAEDLTNPEISERLRISVHTVKTHLQHIRSKLGVTRRRELKREVCRQRQPLRH